MSEEAIICVTCNKEEKDPKKVIECSYCHKCDHFKCKNIIGNAIRKLRELTYFCSLECQEFYQRTTRNLVAENQVLNELHTVLAEVRETRSDMKAVKSTIDDMEKFQNFLSGQLDTLLAEMKTMKLEHSTLKANVEVIEKKYHSVCNTVDSLEMEVDRINRASISKNTIILGIPAKSNEVPEQIVHKIAASVGLQLPAGAVLEAKRLISKETARFDNKTHPIKITFSEVRHKEELFSKKQKHGLLLSSAVDPTYTGTVSKVILRDELTPYGMRLLKKVREIQDLVELKFVWPGRNGVILTNKNENSKIEAIRCHTDAEQLERMNLTRQLSSSSPNTSADLEPNPKRRP